METAYKWFIGLGITVTMSVMGWQTVEMYNLNANSKAHDINIQLLKDNQDINRELLAEKNKNVNKRIDKNQDYQKEVNNTNTSEHKAIEKKLDKLFNYIKLRDKKFNEYLNLITQK